MGTEALEAPTDVDTATEDASDATDATATASEQDESTFWSDLDAKLNGDNGPAEDAEDAVESDGPDDVQDSNTYTVKVDGEELQVTLEEALAGHMRHADYTRKTQALAPERERLASYANLEQQLQSDPASTIAALAEAFGVSAPLNGGDGEVDLDSLDPLERELHELRQWRETVEKDRQSQKQVDAERAVRQEAKQALEAVGLGDVSDDELLQFAVDKRIGDLHEAAEFFLLKRGNTPKPSTQRDDKLHAKRTAPPVAGGAKRNGTITPGRAKTLDEAMRMAASSRNRK